MGSWPYLMKRGSLEVLQRLSARRRKGKTVPLLRETPSTLPVQIASSCHHQKWPRAHIMCHFRAVALQQCHRRAWLYILGRQGRHCCRPRSPRVLAEARQVPPRAVVRMFSATLIAVRIGLGLTARACAASGRTPSGATALRWSHEADVGAARLVLISPLVSYGMSGCL
jgi:hypothetical protein